MAARTTVFAAFAVLLTFIVFLTYSPRRRTSTLQTLGIYQTTPQDLQSQKQSSTSNQLSATYEYVFPPHRREALTEISEPLSGSGQPANVLSKLLPDYAKLVPDKTVSDSDEQLAHVTATGFTVGEIRRIGDFPDYASLSGVPLPNECDGFDIGKATPRPYRPLRWPYHQTMSLMKLDPDHWLELESTYVERIRQRQQLYTAEGSAVLQKLPGSELATKELMEICVQFLCARHPQHFRLATETMILHNGFLGTTTDLKATDPLKVLLNNVPEDFAIMLRDPNNGIYSFRAGIIMSAQGWTLGSKIGLKVHEIHDPVIDYREKMKFSMDRYFAKMPTDKPIQRGSWSLEVGEPLYMPPGHPHEKLREEQMPNLGIDRCRLRVDWQTLRRLPLSGAVIFNFKALFTPVAEFRHEPYIPSLLLKVLKEGNRAILEHKGTWHTEHIVIPALEEYERQQIAKALIEKDWEAKTLDESPFYPGWQERWHAKQGF